MAWFLHRIRLMQHRRSILQRRTGPANALSSPRAPGELFIRQVFDQGVDPGAGLLQQAQQQVVIQHACAQTTSSICTTSSSCRARSFIWAAMVCGPSRSNSSSITGRVSVHVAHGADKVDRVDVELQRRRANRIDHIAQPAAAYPAARAHALRQPGARLRPPRLRSLLQAVDQPVEDCSEMVVADADTRCPRGFSDPGGHRRWRSSMRSRAAEGCHAADAFLRAGFIRVDQRPRTNR